MNTFYVVRHGKTLNNETGRLSGWIDSPLTSEGLQPLEVVAAKLQGKTFDAMYASDLGRAFITAYELARKIGWEGEIMRSPGLREVNYGVAGNMLATEAYERYPLLDRDTHFVPENGESLDTMQRRVFQTIGDIDVAHTDDSILIVAHSGVMAALNAGHLGQDFGEHNISEAYPHESVNRFTYADGQITSFAAVG